MVNESLTAELKRYKECVTIFEQRQNVDLNKCENYSQMDDLIRNRNAKLTAFQQEIDTLKETLSTHVKEKESLSKTLKQAFWLKHTNYNPDTSVNSNTPVRIEAPSELSKHYNDQLLKQVMSQEIVHIAVNSMDILNVNKSCVDECNKFLELETELLKKKDLIEKDSQEKDTVIRQLKDRIKSLSGKDSMENVKKYIEEIEMINIELEHSVALKNELRKLKGQNVFDTAISKPSATIAPGMFKLDIEPISHRLKNNKDAHEVYLEKTIENTDTLRGLDTTYSLWDNFCDSDLDVAFRKHTCFIRNLEGVDLHKGSRGSNLYTLSMVNLLLSSPICLLSKASKIKSWLWHRRLSHLNFDYITSLAKQGLFRGLPKQKYQKDHLCSAYALGKSKKHSHKPKAKDSIQEKLYLLHMDLCGLMRIHSINGRKYILVIVDDYYLFTWVKFLRSKDEVLEFVIKFLKMIQVHLNTTVCNIRTDNGTKFVNQTLRAYYEEFGISHQTSVASTPQQNGVVKRRNHTLVEASHTIKPDLYYLYVFDALCYPTNDGEDLGKSKPKANIGIFVGYAPAKKAFRIYNKRTRMIIKTIHVDFDELTAMTSKEFSLGPGPKRLTPGTISLRLLQNIPSSTLYVPPIKNDWELLFQLVFDEYLNPPPCVD
ncbi:retrovirus-related pol polyprotein from transposon TNT 1-94 [Tanacetum coccineum]